MGGIFVVVEHRQGKVRDITLEMLSKAGELKNDLGGELTAVLLGWETGSLTASLRGRADRILVVEDERVKNFQAEVYQLILQQLIQEVHPSLTLIGQTSWGLDLAPCLAVRLGFPLVTDCLDIQIEAGKATALRQVYGGKVFARVSLKESPGYLATMRPGAVSPDPSGDGPTEVVKKEFPSGLPESKKQLLELIESESREVDIAQAEFLVSVGRGVGEEENLALVRELAQVAGGRIVLLPTDCGQELAAQVSPGGHLGQIGQAQGLPGPGHQRGLSARGRDQRRRDCHRGQQGPQRRRSLGWPITAWPRIFSKSCRP